MNSDRVQGATYQGRLELAEGKAEQAARTFERVTQQLPYNSALWRLLGQARLEAGQVNQAIDALARAIQSKPDDVASAKLYARALARLGRTSEALAVVGRGSQVHASVSRDDDLLALWLDLEAAAGNRDEALRVRREMFRADPSNTNNGVVLAQLLVQAGEADALDEATATLDALQSQSVDPLIMTQLRALVARARGSAQDGNAIFEAHISALQEDEKIAPARMAQAAYLQESGLEDESIAVLEAARPMQGPTRDVDRQLGNYFFNLATTLSAEAARLDAIGRGEEAAAVRAESKTSNERAAAAYQSVVDSGDEKSDDTLGVSKRLVETKIRLEDLNGAKATLANVAKSNPDDLEVLVLSSAIAEEEGDLREARRFLARAVEVHPSAYLPFYRRALLNRSNPAMFPDVIQDLDQVLRLRPDMMDAWGLRFDLYAGRNQLDQAFVELRKGIENAGPANRETLTRVLVQQLLTKRRENEALTAVIEAGERWPESAFWQGSSGDLCRRLGRHREASIFFQRLFDMPETQADDDRRRAVAASLLDSLLQRGAPPTRGHVMRLMEEVNQMEETVPIIALRARAHSFLDNRPDTTAIGLLDQAYALAEGDSALLGYWYSQMRMALGSEGEAQRHLAKMAASAPLPPALATRQLGYQRLTVGSRAAHVGEADRLVAASEGDPVAQLEALKLLSNIQYDLAAALEKTDPSAARAYFEAALASAQRGRTIDPDDLELNNNLGYILAKHLGRGAEAKQYAEQAERLAPDNSAVLDTIGTVYLAAGELDLAERHLRNAIRTALVPDHAVLSNIHLAQVLVAREDNRGAGQALQEAERALSNVRTEGSRVQYQAEIDAVRQTIP